MPIRFRCSYCNRLLGIATRKAGTQTTCPHCGYQITVPVPNNDDSKTERVNLDDVDEILGRGTTEHMPAPAVATAPATTAAPPAPAEATEQEPAPAPLELPPDASRTGPTKLVPPPAPASKPRPSPPPIPKPATKPSNPGERPLFENDVDEILGSTDAPKEEKNAKPPTSGMDAMSLDEPARAIVISAQKATILMVAVVVLMALSFAAGYFLK